MADEKRFRIMVPIEDDGGVAIGWQDLETDDGREFGSTREALSAFKKYVEAKQVETLYRIVMVTLKDTTKRVVTV